MKNREIKFRIWDGAPIKDGFDGVMIDMDYACKSAYLIDAINGKYPIMQFIGLLDKNGVEIYEGDICRILYTDWPSNTDPNIPLEDYLISISHIGIIEYHAPCFYIMLKDRYDELSPTSLNYGTHGRLEVIGTIHTTPELL